MKYPSLWPVEKNKGNFWSFNDMPATIRLFISTFWSRVSWGTKATLIPQRIILVAAAACCQNPTTGITNHSNNLTEFPTRRRHWHPNLQWQSALYLASYPPWKMVVTPIFPIRKQCHPWWCVQPSIAHENTPGIGPMTTKARSQFDLGIGFRQQHSNLGCDSNMDAGPRRDCCWGLHQAFLWCLIRLASEGPVHAVREWWQMAYVFPSHAVIEKQNKLRGYNYVSKPDQYFGEPRYNMV